MASHMSKKRMRVPSPPLEGAADILPAAAKSPERKGKGKKRKGQAPDPTSAATYFDIYGEEGRAEVTMQPTGAIRPSDVQALLLWILAEGDNPKWVFVKAKPLVQRVVLLYLPGLSRSLYDRHRGALPHIAALLGKPATVTAKNATVHPAATVGALFTTPAQKKRKQEESEATLDPRATSHGVSHSAAAAGAAKCESAAKGERTATASGGRAEATEEGEISEVSAPHSTPSTQSTSGGLSAALAAAQRALAGCVLPGISRRIPAAKYSPSAEAGVVQLVKSPARDPSDSTEVTRTAGGPGNNCSDAAEGGDDVHTGHGHKRQHFTVEHYVATLAELEVYGFPLPSVDLESQKLVCQPGYVATRLGVYASEEERTAAKARMVALDCEMCETAEGLALTRATLLDGDGKVLFDELVLPESPITDYVTQFSGITAQMMAGVTTSLPDIQVRLLKHVSAETLLVGHALENDLRVLRMTHGRVLDTAIMYPHPKGPPARCALRILAQRYLKRRIQEGSHDSVDDALAALDLVLLKVKHGPAFGMPKQGPGERLMEVLAAAKRRASLVDQSDMLNRHLTGTANAMVCESDADVVAKALKAVRQAGGHFVWAQLRDLSVFFDQRARRAAQPTMPQSDAGASAEVASIQSPAVGKRAGGPSASTPEDGEIVSPTDSRNEGRRGKQAPAASRQAQRRSETECDPQAEGAAELEAVLRGVDEAVGKLHGALLPNTLLMLYTGQGDTAETRQMQTDKYRRQAQLEGLAPWTQAADDDMTRACKEASQGLCFCVVKQ